MDEFNELRDKLFKYLSNYDNIYEIGINDITKIKDKLDEFMLEFYSLETKLNVPGADPEFIKKLNDAIDDEKNVVDDNKNWLDKVHAEKLELSKDVVVEITRVTKELNELIHQKDHAVLERDIKSLQAKIDELVKKRRALVAEYRTLLDGGKYTNYKTKIINNHLDSVTFTRSATSSSPSTTSTPSSKEEPKPSTPPKKDESKPKKKKEIVENSIKYYIDKNMLPGNLEPSQWQALCKELGVKAAHTNVALSQSDFDKLRYSKSVHEASVRASIETKHKRVVSEYDRMIQKYKKLSSEMIAPELKSDKEQIDAMIANLEKEKADYSAKVKAMGYDVKKYFDLEQGVYNTAETGKALKVEEKLVLTDEKLKDAYQELEDQKQELKTSHSKFKKAIVNRRINKTTQRISKLQAKQGKLSTTQNMIVNASTDRYIKKKEEERRKQSAEHERMSEYAAKINQMNEQKDALSRDIEDINKDLANVTGNRLRDKFERLELKSSRRKLENELKRLKNKQGMTILANQVRQSISSTRGR